jgi:hypothetical protein
VNAGRRKTGCNPYWKIRLSGRQRYAVSAQAAVRFCPGFFFKCFASIVGCFRRLFGGMAADLMHGANFAAERKSIRRLLMILIKNMI